MSPGTGTEKLGKQDRQKGGILKAMIFAAGLGTRFQPWTDTHPKALAQVNGKSLLQRNIEYLQEYDITDVVVNVHHFADQVIDAIEKANGWGSTITISDESDKLLDTGGGLLKARHLLYREEPLLILNVDVLTDANLKYFLAFHQQQNADITVATTGRTTSRYLLFNKYDRLCGWRNTKTGEVRIMVDAKDLFGKAYSGMAILQPDVLDQVPFTGKFSIIDAYLALAKENKIAAFDHSESKWVDVGTTENQKRAEEMFV